MKRIRSSPTLAYPLVAWLAVACGDTQGNVIERAAHTPDGGGGTGGACPSPGGCAGSGGSANGGAAGGGAGNGGAGSGGAPIGECSSNADCTDPSKRLCNTALHTCAECVVNADCVDPLETCSVALNRCAAPCSSDADCLPEDPVCDLAIGRAGTPGYCVGCRSPNDCLNPDRPFCVEGDCVACANGQC
jgi:hypothetical protein